jgi:hypothetical protein
MSGDNATENSFYESDPTDPSRFVSMGHTRGPWSEHHQHGGPPAALLVRAAEGAIDARGFQLAQVSLDLVRPVPVAPVRVEARVERAGRRVQLVEAVLLSDDGALLAEARATFVRRDAVQAPACRTTGLPGPHECEPFAFPFASHPVGYQSAMDTRLASREWGGPSCVMWMRAKVALVRDEPPSPSALALLCADASSGVAPPLDVGAYTFPNATLVAHFTREPVGAWVAVDASSLAGPEGLGLARATLHDELGPFGASAQSLVVSAR